MKRAIFIFTSLMFCITSSALEYNPTAKPEACVVCGNARFTVLTDKLIRMEWSKDSLFEDRASLAIVNRDLPLCKYSVNRTPGKLVIKTNSVTLTYTGLKDEAFTAENLAVSFKMNGKNVVWHPGDAASGNLRGTTRTLDRIGGRSSKTALAYRQRKTNEFVPLELEDGILSRDGWAIVDESNRHVMDRDDSDWGEWVTARPSGERQDLYIFAYGHDYKAAMADFIKVAGHIPLPPKYTFGYWWSRYWAYTDEEMLSIAKEMRDRDIPMDVFIIDMDWHQTWKELAKRDNGRDEFGQRVGWTGYTWNGDLIPDPKGLLKNMHALGYKIALNLHPASGIRPFEESYRRFTDDYLTRCNDYDGPKDYVYGKEKYVFEGNDSSYAREGFSAPVPFRLDQQAWADSYFSQVIRPLEKTGVDFWWLDWQQWIESKYVKGLSNTYWCNWAFFNDKLRQGKSSGKYADRPFIYHRWGGLGSHRYPLGFSGDTYDEWEVLGLEPYFTATASNVGYGYWGHDLGGHMQLTPHNTDPEIYTRWLQYGVFTPIFKTHSTQKAELERKIWAYPEHYEYMKEAIILRYALTPYIYTAARQAYDTGICICRPLYYEYPEDKRAYDFDEEFFFGDKILATVLCQPAVNGKTERAMWFPAGSDWYDMAAHTMRKGGTTQKLYYSIDQNPWFVKAGSVITMAPVDIKNLQGENCGLRLLVVPGSASCTVRMYEDDGCSQAYDNEYSFTEITKKCSGGKTILTIGPREGSYCGASKTRDITIMMEGVKKMPSSVLLNGEKLDEGISLEENGVYITLPSVAADEKTVVEIR